MKNLLLGLICLCLITQLTPTSLSSIIKIYVSKANIKHHKDAQNEAFKELKYVFQSNTSCTTDCCKTLSPSRPPMTYHFYQNTGRFIGGLGDFAIDTHGYSGQDQGYLNPDKQCVVNIGPLPASTYKITWCKNVMHETVQRPCAFFLQPQNQSQMCGRGDFFIHGCNCCTPGDSTQPPSAGCSAGCIVINYENRRKIRIGDTILVHHYEPKNVKTE